MSRQVTLDLDDRQDRALEVMAAEAAVSVDRLVSRSVRLLIEALDDHEVDIDAVTRPSDHEAFIAASIQSGERHGCIDHDTFMRELDDLIDAAERRAAG